MPDILIIIIVVIFGFTASIVVPKTINALGKKPVIENDGTSSQQKRLTREDIQSKLKKLSHSLKPIALAPGAMCYEIAAPPDRAEYVCPKDCDKTIFTTEMTGFILWELPQMRESVKELQKLGLEAKLDESEFCKKCSPNQKENPQLKLVIAYPDGKVNILRGVYGGDMRLIQEFLSGAKKHSTSHGSEEPLKEYIPRLEQLLGVKVK